MDFLCALWLPILLSAAFVFVISSLIHMMLQYHKNDFKKLPNEDAVMDALRKFDIPKGDYVMPYAGTMKAMSSAEYVEKQNKGPVAVMTFIKCGKPGMAKSLILWFLYSLVVSVFAAYICDRAVGGPGAHYLKVFRFVGASAFMGYAFALCQNSIWYARNWGATIRSMFDGFIYALVTAGVFGWLWPR
jgi:hypothetical protein